MGENKTICFDQKPTTIKGNRSKKNGQGEILETWEVDVPATKYYRTYYGCKHRGYEDFVISNKTQKN